MRLKGKLLERLPKEKRERMERTLKRMEDVRRNDDMRLRAIIDAKKEWAEKEREKGFEVITQLKNQIKQLEDNITVVESQITKLDGCLLVLNELVAEAAELAKSESTPTTEESTDFEENKDKSEKKKSKKKIVSKK